MSHGRSNVFPATFLLFFSPCWCVFGAVDEALEFEVFSRDVDTGANASAVFLQNERRLRGAASLPPFVLRMKRVHLVLAQGVDRFRSYVSRVVFSIAASLNIDVIKIQPVALLVYRDPPQTRSFFSRDYGTVVLLFSINTNCGVDHDLCARRHATWLQAWGAVVNSTNASIHALSLVGMGQVDSSFSPVLTPALCAQWEIRGPGCNMPLYRRRGEENRGLPMWFVIGVGSMCVFLCAIYPIWRVVKLRRHPLAVDQQTSTDVAKLDLQNFRREKVSVRRLAEDATCPICLSKPSDDLKEEVLIPPCSHCLHVSCAEAWFAKHMQCPLCRRSFSPDECVVWQLVEGEGNEESPAVDAGATLPHPHLLGHPTAGADCIEKTEQEETNVDAGRVFADPAAMNEEAPDANSEVVGAAEVPDEPQTTNGSVVMPDPRSSLMRVAVERADAPTEGQSAPSVEAGEAGVQGSTEESTL